MEGSVLCSHSETLLTEARSQHILPLPVQLKGLTASIECSGWAVIHFTSPYSPLVRTCQIAPSNFKGTEKYNFPMNQKTINTRNVCYSGE